MKNDRRFLGRGVEVGANFRINGIQRGSKPISLLFETGRKYKPVPRGINLLPLDGKRILTGFVKLSNGRI